MTKHQKEILVLLVLGGLVLLGVLFWYSRPSPPETSLILTGKERAVNELKKHTVVGELNIPPSENLGKENPFE